MKKMYNYKSCLYCKSLGKGYMSEIRQVHSNRIFKIQVFAHQNLRLHIKTIATFGQNVLLMVVQAGGVTTAIIYKGVSCHWLCRIIYRLANSLMSTANLSFRRHSQPVSLEFVIYLTFMLLQDGYGRHP